MFADRRGRAWFAERRDRAYFAGHRWNHGSSESGASTVIPLLTTTEAQRREAVLDLTDGRGPDVIVEATGRNTFSVIPSRSGSAYMPRNAVGRRRASWSVGVNVCRSVINGPWLNTTSGSLVSRRASVSTSR